MAFALFNSAYVTTLSCLLAQGEAERYRFNIEAFLWMLARPGRGGFDRPSPPPRAGDLMLDLPPCRTRALRSR